MSTTAQRKSFWRAQLTGRKISFYTLFHGFHVLLLIIGWYVDEETASNISSNLAAGGSRPQTKDLRLSTHSPFPCGFLEVLV